MLIVAVTTYIVLLLFFRSLLLPLKAILMNTLSILASYGMLVVIFQDGFLHQLLNFTPLGFVEASSPILLFCALFGLSMDYEVFLLSRMQEAFWQTGDNTRAVALGLQRSGGIITSAAVIVVVVSACFATADMILVKALGLGMALAVALDATLVRGLLVPGHHAPARQLELVAALRRCAAPSIYSLRTIRGGSTCCSTEAHRGGRRGWRKTLMKRRSLRIMFALLTLLLASCGFPGIPSTSAQLPQVNISPTPTRIAADSLPAR